jgi:hypothetical protein
MFCSPSHTLQKCNSLALVWHYALWTYFSFTTRLWIHPWQDDSHNSGNLLAYISIQSKTNGVSLKVCNTIVFLFKFLSFLGWGETESTESTYCTSPGWWNIFFFRFPNLFAICIHTFKYNQQIVWVWSGRWNKWQGKQKYSEKPCVPRPSLRSAQIPDDLVSNTSIRGGKPVINCFSYGMASATP